MRLLRWKNGPTAIADVYFAHATGSTATTGGWNEDFLCRQWLQGIPSSNLNGFFTIVNVDCNSTAADEPSPGNHESHGQCDNDQNER